MLKRPQSYSTPSIYSHTTTRSAGTGMRSARSIRSLQIPWYKTPWLQHKLGTDIQKYAVAAAIYTIVLSAFTMGTTMFDFYCLIEATPGSTHYGYYIISFDFVYVGNQHVRNGLITIAIFSTLLAFALLVTSFMLIQGLRNEYEEKMIPWLIVMFVFTIFRFLAFIFAAVVNDLIFAYNVVMFLFWIVFSGLNVAGFAVVYSLYLELADLTKLEDLAHLRMGTMTSLATQSMAGSRPTSRPTTPRTPMSGIQSYPLP